ncbi:Uncharacterized conserved protein, DUF2141 family [Flagellimonas taeanensis]|uniref:Uncharacterized conserved protein, DUF2141 family n=1 Tax=Flagellimonas taeanensis TaxID=1005926 RepID=A0A1M6Y0M0_9FLAO|nr:DUF2141 domain-containing protein [Allomuricauda taeanensis]MEE1961812.1 DUF2141 domain-containing protein [Allomuricauda taeanensis]SFC04560.1 Uncharacterized conserved protein, DUF2141 family [Allomuricauda taeanensis]SHL11760.1 Uncharacterized conserved protein, DUF2141 family [Allomuricauda taeanensis]
MRGILFCTLVLPLFVFSQNTISVHINNVESNEGQIKVAIYDSDDSFLSFEQVYRGSSVKAQKGQVILRMEDIPSGEYALAIFHDENGNGKLDTNWLGIPRERVAFSHAKMKTFGPPKYKECAFKVTADHEISIDL